MFSCSASDICSVYRLVSLFCVARLGFIACGSLVAQWRRRCAQTLSRQAVIHSFAHPLTSHIDLFVHLFIHMSNIFIRSFMHSCVRVFVNSCVHVLMSYFMTSCIHSFNQSFQSSHLISLFVATCRVIAFIASHSLHSVHCISFH